MLNYTASHPVSKEAINKLNELNKNIYHEEQLADLSEFGIIKNIRMFGKEINMHEYFNVSIIVNSYNVKNPVEPYPENFEIPHDGVFVCCEVIQNGAICYYKYCGD
jgi:hypothetical protein